MRLSQIVLIKTCYLIKAECLEMKRRKWILGVRAKAHEWVLLPCTDLREEGAIQDLMLRKQIVYHTKVMT